MKSILSIAIFLLSAQLMAADKTIYFKKLVDSKDQSVLIMGCESVTASSCRVLGGGSISAVKVAEMRNKLLMRHHAQNAGIVTTLTLASAINPIVILSFLSVPVGAVTFAGTSAFIYFKHKTFESYKKVQLFSNEASFQMTSSETINSIDQVITELRK